MSNEIQLHPNSPRGSINMIIGHAHNFWTVIREHFFPYRFIYPNNVHISAVLFTDPWIRTIIFLGHTVFQIWTSTIYLSPWLLNLKWKEELPVLSFWCFMGISFLVWNTVAVFLICFQWIPLQTMSKQKKVHRKIFTKTNFTKTFPGVVLQHIRIVTCQAQPALVKQVQCWPVFLKFK